MVQQKRNSGVGCWIVIVGFLIIGLIISSIRYFQDKSGYKKAHAAYLEGNCVEAIKTIDDFTSKFRPFDFAKVVDDANAEKQECQQFQSAQELQDGNKISEAFLAYDKFTTSYPKSPMTSTVQDNIKSLFSSSSLPGLASTEICAGIDKFIGSGMIAEPDQYVPKLLIACSDYYSGMGEVDTSLGFLVQLLDKYKDSPSASMVRRNLHQYPVACLSYESLKQQGIIPTDDNALAQYLYDCAEYSYSTGDFFNAASMYESLIFEFPDHSLAAQVEKNYADAMIKVAIAKGAGKIPQPDPSGFTSAGNTIVEIQNDSPERLKLVFSGPVARIEYLDACSTCIEYSIISPTFCPEKGPIGKYTLPSGDYQVLVEAASVSDVTSYVSTWTMESGRQFYSCFYIVKR